MDFGAVIGVVLGMVLVFSLLSIIVTQINTLITNGLRLRARVLRKGITELLSDPAIRAQVLTHPLVRVVNPGLSNTVTQAVRSADAHAMQAVSEQVTVGRTLTGVTWVEPKIFTDALFGILSDAAEKQIYQPFYQLAKGIRDNTAREDVNDVICQLSTNDLSIEDTRAQFLEKLKNEPGIAIQLTEKLDELREVRETILVRNRNQHGDLIALLEGVDKLSEDTETKRALQVLIGSAHKVEEAQERVSSWFDAQMKRLSEHYGRRLVVYTTLVGAFVTVALNVDAIQLARALWDDPVLRGGAQQVAQTASVALEQAIQQSVVAATPAAPADPEATPDPAADADFTDESQAIAQAVTSITTSLNSLSELRLPIGWYSDAAAAEACFLIAAQNREVAQDAAAQASAQAASDETAVTTETDVVQEAINQATPPRCDDKRNLAQIFPIGIPNGEFDVGLLLAKLLGWALTTLAIGQGSPFWFDLLKKVTAR
jgi:hypothetical protein